MRLGGDVSQLAFDPAGSYLAAAGYQDRAVPIWDVMANVMVARLSFGSSEPRRLAFSADHRTLVVAGSDRAQTWDLQAADERRTWSVHRDGVCGVNFSRDGRRLVSTSHDRTAIIWDVATGQPRLKLTGFRGPVQAAAFSADGRLLATADQEGPVRLWLADTGEELAAIPDLPWQHSFHVEFSPGGDYLAATGDGLSVWRCAHDSGQPAVPAAGGLRAWQPLTARRLQLGRTVARLGGPEYQGAHLGRGASSRFSVRRPGHAVGVVCARVPTRQPCVVLYRPDRTAGVLGGGQEPAGRDDRPVHIAPNRAFRSLPAREGRIEPLGRRDEPRAVHPSARAQHDLGVGMESDGQRLCRRPLLRRSK